MGKNYKSTAVCWLLHQKKFTSTSYIVQSEPRRFEFRIQLCQIPCCQRCVVFCSSVLTDSNWLQHSDKLSAFTNWTAVIYKPLPICLRGTAVSLSQNVIVWRQVASNQVTTAWLWVVECVAQECCTLHMVTSNAPTGQPVDHHSYLKSYCK